MYHNIIKKWVLIFMSWQFMAALAVLAQENFNWDKELVQKVKITDRAIINKLVLDLFIPESNIEYLEIFDVDANGATDGDLMRAHPSRNVYSLSMLSKESRDILASIPQPPNIEDIGLTVNINNPETAQERVLFILASTVKELYSQDKPLKLYFEQNTDGTYRFNFFGYKPEALKHDKDITLGKTQKQQIHDLLKALYKEFNEEFVDWQPAVIHVVKIERDTLFVPEAKVKK